MSDLRNYISQIKKTKELKTVKTMFQQNLKLLELPPRLTVHMLYYLKKLRKVIFV